MEQLAEQLGIEWKLLLSQAVNFLILLVVLRFTVYKPLLNLLAKRREKIEAGLEKAKEADRRLAEISEVKREKLREAEREAMALMRASEERAKREAQAMLVAAREKEETLRKEAKQRIEAERLAELEATRSQAASLVKQILVKAVELKPEHIDEALIEKVARESQLKANT